MKTVYVQTPVSEKPEKDGLAHVIFNHGTDHECLGTVDYCEQYSFHAENIDCSGIEFWLRPVPVSGVPTSEDRMLESETFCPGDDPQSHNSQSCFVAGADWAVEQLIPIIADRNSQISKLHIDLSNEQDKVAALSEERDRMKDLVDELKDKSHALLFHLNNAYPTADMENEKQRKAYLSYHDLKAIINKK